MLPLQRGLSHLRAGVSSTTTAARTLTRIQNIQPSQDSMALDVAWEDGKSGSFPYIWLRDCAKEQRPSYLNELSLGVRPEKLGLCESGEKVTIQWPPYCMAQYSSEWLRDNVKVDRDEGMLTELRPANPTAIPWNNTIAAPLDYAVPWTEAERDPELVFKRLDKLGFALLTDAGDGAEARLTETLRLSGATVAYLEESDLAKTRSIATRVPYIDQIPEYHGILALETGTEGTFQLVDGFTVANDFRNRNPELFEFATQTTLDYCNHDESLRAPHPLVSLSPEGRVQKVVFNNAMRCVETIPHEKYKLYYKAIKCFHDLCYSSRNAVEMDLKSGDLLLLDNSRVLAGSSAFLATSPTKPRYRLTTYNL